MYKFKHKRLEIDQYDHIYIYNIYTCTIVAGSLFPEIFAPFLRSVVPNFRTLNCQTVRSVCVG